FLLERELALQGADLLVQQIDGALAVAEGGRQRELRHAEDRQQEDQHHQERGQRVDITRPGVVVGAGSAAGEGAGHQPSAEGWPATAPSLRRAPSFSAMVRASSRISPGSSSASAVRLCAGSSTRRGGWASGLRWGGARASRSTSPERSASLAIAARRSSARLVRSRALSASRRLSWLSTLCCRLVKAARSASALVASASRSAAWRSSSESWLCRRAV